MKRNLDQTPQDYLVTGKFINFLPIDGTHLGSNQKGGGGLKNGLCFLSSMHNLQNKISQNPSI